jgi:TonB-dependent receptor
VVFLSSVIPIVSAAGIDAAATGTISGSVSNAATGNLLEGAIIEISRLRLTALTDQTGRYVFQDLPAGTHEVVASYTGLDPGRRQVTVRAGERAGHDFDLTSSVYVLDAVKVTGEREGSAAAITARRNAANVKNVVSIDEYGNLPNLNAGELALRLPGVTVGNPGDEVLEGISVRGMGVGLNTVTVDGGLLASFGAMNRQTRMQNYNGAMFEQLELIKAHTPDRSADSLGGTVNLKTRSPLSLREKRRIGYTLSVVHAAAFTEQIPLREQHRTHPLFQGSYQEKFRVFGGAEENLGVAVNAFYSENVFGFFRTLRDFQQTNATPAYLWDYRTLDNFNNRKQKSVSAKFDHRLARHTKLTLNLIYNDHNEPIRRQYLTRAFAGNQNTVPGAATGIVPGAFTDRVTVVRAVPTPATATSATVPAAAIDVTATMISRDLRLRHADLGGEHRFGRFELDWAAQWSRSRYRSLNNEGALVNRIGGIPFIGPNGQPGTPTNNLRAPNGDTGVGWILDRTQSDLYPRFIQNGGLDFTNPDNYRPVASTGLTSNAGDLQHHLVTDIRGNAKYQLPVATLTAFLKAGGGVREQTAGTEQNRRRWSYLGRNALPTAPSILLWDNVKTGRNIPVWEAAAFVQNGQPVQPDLWQEDRYFHEQTSYTGFTEVRETVTSGYVMAQGGFGQNGFLTGVRTEKTDTKAFVYVRNRVASTPAQQQADPVGTAQRDYANNFRTRDGSYTKSFPSIHLWRNFTPNLKGRVSWSTSFGRPPMDNALPIETANETAQTLTVGNPELLPQTARNWDLVAEYYFEPAGNLSVGWFHKAIENFIVSGINVGPIAAGTDNGYNGEYAGFMQLTTSNAGRAIAQGWEFSYVQQFRFLPGLLKGLRLNANFTILNAHGTYAGTTYLRNNQVPGFVPRSGNLSLSWNYRKFGTRLLYNYTSEQLAFNSSFNAAAPSRSNYMMAREVANLSLTWQLRPNVTLQLDVANIFNEPQRFYRGIPDQLERFLIQPPRITAGVQGQF